jgi:hypothetical protein
VPPPYTPHSQPAFASLIELPQPSHRRNTYRHNFPKKKDNNNNNNRTNDREKRKTNKTKTVAPAPPRAKPGCGVARELSLSHFCALAFPIARPCTIRLSSPHRLHGAAAVTSAEPGPIVRSGRVWLARHFLLCPSPPGLKRALRLPRHLHLHLQSPCPGFPCFFFPKRVLVQAKRVGERILR